MEDDNQRKQYALSTEERVVMQQLNFAAVNAKANIHDAQEALDQAQKLFAGALTLLAQAHGMSNADITPDFARITAR